MESIFYSVTFVRGLLQSLRTVTADPHGLIADVCLIWPLERWKVQVIFGATVAI